MAEKCFCGKELHYTDPLAQSLVQQLVDDYGTHLKITVGKRTWLVQRHYIALHGISATDLPYLGFQEVTDEASEFPQRN